jgi:hypothetical protein
MTRYLEIAFIVLMIVGLCMYDRREGFSLRDAGSVNSKLLLEGWYPVNKPTAEISDLTMEDQYVNYPIFPAHYTKNVNNLRQWRKPNNGQCSPPDLCGKVYSDRKVTLPKQPKMPGFDNGTRVNFYNVC